MLSKGKFEPEDSYSSKSQEFLVVSSNNLGYWNLRIEFNIVLDFKHLLKVARILKEKLLDHLKIYKRNPFHHQIVFKVRIVVD